MKNFEVTAIELSLILAPPLFTDFCVHVSPASDHNKAYFELITNFTSGLKMASKAHRSYRLLKLFPIVLYKILKLPFYVIYMYSGYNCGGSVLLCGHILTGITAIKLRNGPKCILPSGFKFNLL